MFLIKTGLPASALFESSDACREALPQTSHAGQYDAARQVDNAVQVMLEKLVAQEGFLRKLQAEPAMIPMVLHVQPRRLGTVRALGDAFDTKKKKFAEVG